MGLDYDRSHFGSIAEVIIDDIAVRGKAGSIRTWKQKGCAVLETRQCGRCGVQGNCETTNLIKQDLARAYPRWETCTDPSSWCHGLT